VEARLERFATVQYKPPKMGSARSPPNKAAWLPPRLTIKGTPSFGSPWLPSNASCGAHEVSYLFMEMLFVGVGYAAPINTVTPPNVSSCSCPSPKDFVDQVRRSKLNVTDIVSRCPNSCTVLFGSGNSVCL
jgi:hypothetical protein